MKKFLPRHPTEKLPNKAHRGIEHGQRGKDNYGQRSHAETCSSPGSWRRVEWWISFAQRRYLPTKVRKSKFILRGKISATSRPSQKEIPTGVSKLLASLGHSGRIVSGHMLNTLWHVSPPKSHILRKFTMLCWAAFTAILSCMWPAGRRLDTPVGRRNMITDWSLIQKGTKSTASGEYKWT